jgi:hypothetical protein
MYKLSSSIWARNGYNQENNAFIPYTGAQSGIITKKITLPSSTNLKEGAVSSVVVCDDKFLRVSHKGMLSAIDRDCNIIWSIDIDFDERHSSIVSLEGNKTLLYTEDTVLIYDCNGETEFKKVFDVSFDDSSISPNVTTDGYIAIGSICEDVFLVSKNDFKILDTKGYDIPTPAINKDNKIVVSAYCGLGACCFDTDGNKIYNNSICKEVDLLPVINSKGITAIGSLNDKCSYFLDKSGNVIHTINVAAVYTEYIDGGWIELSHNRLRRINNNYDEIWNLKINMRDINGFYLPVVDKDGYIYLTAEDYFLCIDASGRIKYKFNSKNISNSIGMVSDGEMCYIVDDILHIFS